MCRKEICSDFGAQTEEAEVAKGETIRVRSTIKEPEPLVSSPALPARLGAVWPQTSGQLANLEPETQPMAEGTGGSGVQKAGGKRPPTWEPSHQPH